MDDEDLHQPKISLRTNLKWAAVSNLVFAACQWTILTGFARFGNPTAVGQYAMALAITTPIFLLLSLKLRSVQATDARGDYSFGEYFALRLVTLILALIAVGLLVVSTGIGGVTRTVIILVAFAKTFDSLSDIIYGRWQQLEYLQLTAVSRIAQGVLQALAAIILMWQTRSIVWASLGIATASLAVTLGYDLRNAGRRMQGVGTATGEAVHRWHSTADSVLPQWNWGHLGRLAWLSLPAGINVTLGSLQTNVPRLSLSTWVGASGLGIFAAIASLTIISQTLIGALVQTTSPRLAKHCAAAQWDEFNGLLFKLVRDQQRE